MSERLLVFNRDAQNISAALVRNATDLNPISFPQLVIGNSRPFRIQIVSDGDVDPISGNTDYSLTVSIGRRCKYPEGGTYKLAYDGADTADIDFNESPSSLQTKLEDLAGIASGDVVVTGSAGKVYRIEFKGNLADSSPDPLTVSENALTPSSTVSIATLQEGGSGENEVRIIRLRQIPQVVQASWTTDNGAWVGNLSTGSYEALVALAEETGGTFGGILEAVVTHPNGELETIAQIPATIFCDVGEPTNFVPSTLPQFLDASQVYAKRSTITEVDLDDDEYEIDFTTQPGAFLNLDVDDDFELSSTGTVAGIASNVVLVISNTTGTAVDVTTPGAWKPHGDTLTAIGANETIILSLLSWGEDVRYSFAAEV